MDMCLTQALIYLKAYVALLGFDLHIGKQLTQMDTDDVNVVITESCGIFMTCFMHDANIESLEDRLGFAVQYFTCCSFVHMKRKKVEGRRKKERRRKRKKKLNVIFGNTFYEAHVHNEFKLTMTTFYSALYMHLLCCIDIFIMYYNNNQDSLSNRCQILMSIDGLLDY